LICHNKSSNPTFNFNNICSSSMFNSNLGAGYINRFYSSKRLTNVERNSFFVSQDLHEVIIGLTLGDL